MHTNAQPPTVPTHLGIDLQFHSPIMWHYSVEDSVRRGKQEILFMLSVLLLCRRLLADLGLGFLLQYQFPNKSKVF